MALSKVKLITKKRPTIQVFMVNIEQTGAGREVSNIGNAYGWSVNFHPCVKWIQPC